MKTLTLKPAQRKRNDADEAERPFSLNNQGKDDLENPYERCSLYGAALVAAEMYDSDFCVHGPQGCTSAIKEAFSVQGNEYDYHHSGMTQSDIIFGGEKILMKSLTDAFYPYEKFGPKFMVSSCSSEIIGDNMDAIAARVNKGLPLVKVTGSGIKGDQYFGINEALLGLVKKFAVPNPEKKANMVNIIGHIGLSRQWKGDVYESVRLLEGLGMEVNRIACDSTIENIKKAGMSSLTILLTPETGLSAAKYLKDEFDVPYMFSSLFLPLGLRGAEVWLREIGKALSMPEVEIEKLIENEEEIVRDRLKVGLHQMVYVEKLSCIKDMPVAIIAEGSIAFSWARFLAEELGMNPVLIAMRTLHDKKGMETAIDKWRKETLLNPKIILGAKKKDIKIALHEVKTEFIVGSSIDVDMGKEEGVRNFLHISNPNSHYVNINKTPFLGYRGLLNATETILNALNI